MAAFPPHEQDPRLPADQRNPEVDLWVDLTAPSGDKTAIVQPADWTPDDQPFVCQSRDKLLLLVGNAQGWLLAELRFDRRSCTYVETRRSIFAWPREALTALLSRIVTGTDEDARLLRQVSDDFHDWASRQIAVAHRIDSNLCSLSGN